MMTYKKTYGLSRAFEWLFIILSYSLSQKMLVCVHLFMLNGEACTHEDMENGIARQHDMLTCPHTCEYDPVP